MLTVGSVGAVVSSGSVTGGVLGAILAGAFWGALAGGLIGGIMGGITSALSGGSFLDGFADGILSGVISGAITGGFSSSLGPANTLLGNIGRNAGIEALSSGLSDMVITGIDYFAENGTLNGSLDEILIGGLSGAVSGAFSGAISGGIEFKATVAKIESYGLSITDGKVEGKIPVGEYQAYRDMSIQNPSSDTMTLGKYEPTILPDGTKDYSNPGAGAYTVKAGDTTYFSLGTEWDAIVNTYGLDSSGRNMFRFFNQPALDDAVKGGKVIRFSHNPTDYADCALVWEWEYLQSKHGFLDIIKEGDFWYGIK